MTREEILFGLKEMRAKGYTYKLIAKEAGLESVDQLYKFVNRNAPAKEVTRLLETYLRLVQSDESK